MRDNFDKDIGFWIENTAYLWAPGNTLETSRRFYLLANNAAALFDENNNILDQTFIDTATWGGRLDPSETFSLLPVARKNGCEMVRNCFLVWPVIGDSISLENKIAKGRIIKFPYADHIEIRVEGIPIKEWSMVGISEKWSRNSFVKNIITVVNPDTDYRRHVQTYPWRFGNPHVKPPKGVFAEITYQGPTGKLKRFNNLYDAKTKMSIADSDLAYVHEEASSRSLEDEWNYSPLADPAVVKIIYETLIHKRPVYTVRDPEAYGPEQKGGFISALPSKTPRTPPIRPRTTSSAPLHRRAR